MYFLLENMLIFGLGDRPITMPVIFTIVLNQRITNRAKGLRILRWTNSHTLILRFDFSEIFSSLSFRKKTVLKVFAVKGFS